MNLTGVYNSLSQIIRIAFFKYVNTSTKPGDFKKSNKFQSKKYFASAKATMRAIMSPIKPFSLSLFTIIIILPR